ncbi:MAG: DUF5615 family PIN-like protein [Siphonobacter sp.]
MKLLFDQNISHRIISKIVIAFPDASHVREVGLRNADDRTIWNYALSNGYTIVTKDDDFEKFHLVWGFPPKVIWLKVGNCLTEEIARILIQQKDRIEYFISNESQIGLLEVFPISIVP